MKSMTGYGSASALGPSVEFEVQVKTVNGRFLEIRTHLPPELGFLDSEIRTEVAKVFERGRVEVGVSRRLDAAASRGEIRVDTSLALELLVALKSLAKATKLRPITDLEPLLRFPQLVQVVSNSSGQSSDELREFILKLLRKALKACESERQREGAALRAEVQKLLQDLAQSVEGIYHLREEANRQLKDRFLGRLKALGSPGEIPEDRWLPEVALMIEKSDITEEVTRLKEHIRNVGEMVGGSGAAQGKKLDFYAQELLRELNTIGAKSQVVQITRSVVDAKSSVERFKEQVQNIE